MGKTTIVTTDGNVVRGEEVSRSSSEESGLATILGGIATLGMRELVKPNDTVTVKTDRGDYFTGKEK